MHEDKSTTKGGRKARPASSTTSGENVSDPHPGSVSDGTHPEAAERKPPPDVEASGDRRTRGTRGRSA